jgi:hypothetical protein
LATAHQANVAFLEVSGMGSMDVGAFGGHVTLFPAGALLLFALLSLLLFGVWKLVKVLMLALKE